MRAFACLVSICLLAAAARAEEGRPLRLLGEAPTATGSAPRRFFIDAVVKPGDAPFQSQVEGWLAALPPDIGSGEVTGSCVEKACALAVDLTDGKLSLTGDLLAGPAEGKFRFEDDQSGAARFTPLAGMAVPDVGELAPEGAVTAQELADLLAWNGSEGGFNNTDRSGPPSDFEREGLATWQGGSGRPMTGLILTADLQALRDGVRDAKARSGWTALSGAGWSAGYPAALLPVASRNGTERRFASADGKALLVVSVEPARSGEDFDALVEAETADRAGIEDRGYTRVNGDMEIAFTEKGVRRSAAYHNREGAMARIVFTYPAGAEAYQPFETLLTRSLRVTDEVKPE